MAPLITALHPTQVVQGLLVSTIAGQIFTVTQSGATTYTITASAGTGGSISPSGSVSVAQGGSQTFTITANTGYQISNVTVDGASSGAVSSYTFSNVTAAHTISATFSVRTYTITASAGTGGTISPTGSVSVSTMGQTRHLRLQPNTGYSIANDHGGWSISGGNQLIYLQQCNCSPHDQCDVLSDYLYHHCIGWHRWHNFSIRSSLSQSWVKQDLHHNCKYRVHHCKCPR